MHSPKHYDKFTYSTRRRPEGPNGATMGSHNSPSLGRAKTEYEACVAGIAPLAPNPDEGFCIAEDGRISSRWVTPSRFGAPAVALVQVPVTVTTRPREGAQNGTEFESTVRTGIAVSPVRHNLQATSPGSGTRVARSPGRAGPAPLLASPTQIGGGTAVNVKPMTKGGMSVKLITSPSKEVSQGATAAITSSNNSSSTVSYGGSRRRTPTRSQGAGASSGAAPFQRQTSANSTITIQSVGNSPSVITTTPSTTNSLIGGGGGIGGEDWMAWKKLVALAVNEFQEGELVNLSWDAIADLCKHYNLTNPIDTARIQLAWKRKNGELLSDRADIFAPEPQPARETTVYLPTGTMQSPNAHSHGYVRQTSFSSVLSASGLNAQPSSPRRGANEPAYVPSYKSPMRWRNESKIDTGLVKPKHMRATTPTRNQQEPPALVGSTFTRAATPRGKTPTRTPKKVVSSRGM